MKHQLYGLHSSGQFVPIALESAHWGTWHGSAFLPHPLPRECPALQLGTFNAVADARAGLATLSATSQMLPNPQILQPPTLHREAQSTSAMEGTYAPLEDVLYAEATTAPSSSVVEIRNYERAAEHAYAMLVSGRNLNPALLNEVHALLMADAESPNSWHGQLRTIQVVISSTPNAHPADARYVPPPPGDALTNGVEQLFAWITTSNALPIDPIVCAAMAHYQFEALHPYADGNGRIGRLLIVLQLLENGLLASPLLAISPWLEGRRTEYMDRLLAVSTHGDWDGWIRFFAQGVADASLESLQRVHELRDVRDNLTMRVRSSLRADSAIALVDYVIGQPVVTLRMVERKLGISYARAKQLVGQFVQLGILKQVPEDRYSRRFVAVEVLRVLLRS